MDYYEIGKIKVNIKFKEILIEEINEAVKTISRIDFHPISEYEKLVPEKFLKTYKKNKPAGKADVYWIPPDSCQADLYLPAVIKKCKHMYTFIHEMGHVVNKHAGFSFDIDMRETEADEYAVRRMEQWLSKIEKKADKSKIEMMIAVAKMRIKDRNRLSALI